MVLCLWFWPVQIGEAFEHFSLSDKLLILKKTKRDGDLGEEIKCLSDISEWVYACFEMPASYHTNPVLDF